MRKVYKRMALKDTRDAIKVSNKLNEVKKLVFKLLEVEIDLNHKSIWIDMQRLCKKLTLKVCLILNL